MDFWKGIPNFFFELIARFMPGSFFIVLLFFATSKKHSVIAHEFAPVPPAIYDSSLFWIVTLLILSYGMGHVIGGISNYVYHWGGPVHVLKPFIEEGDEYLEQTAKFVRAELGHPDKYSDKLEKEVWYWYDWLRLHFPSAGSITARMRAESIMCISLAVAFLVASITRIAVSLPYDFGFFDVIFILTTLIIAFLMAEQKPKIERTFKLSVVNFYRVARTGGGQSDASTEIDP